MTVNLGWIFMNLFWVVAILLFPLILLCLLQYYLAKQKNASYSLILPGISVAVSLVASLGYLFFSISTNVLATLLTTVVIFGFYNIPTLIFMSIRNSVRAKLRRIEDLERMSIQDIE